VCNDGGARDLCAVLSGRTGSSFRTLGPLIYVVLSLACGPPVQPAALTPTGTVETGAVTAPITVGDITYVPLGFRSN